MELTNFGMNGYTPQISEEEKLKNLLETCDQMLEKEPHNTWWQNVRASAQERLEEIYLAQHNDTWAEAVAAFREQQELLITM